MGHKVYAQYRFGEEPVEVFDTSKSARFNEHPTKDKAVVGKVGNSKQAAEDFAKKLRGQVPCNIVIEEVAEPKVVESKVAEPKGGK